MLDNLEKYNIVLASNSPRRKQLLAGIGVEFEVRVLKDIDESYPADSLEAHDVPLYIAKKKAEGNRGYMADNDLLITADTVVIVDNEILGKPVDEADAKCMLRKLSGKTHCVVTGVCLTSKGKQQSFAVSTDVTFKKLTEEEIDYYVSKYKPLDKAGAYGIQEWIGYIGVTGIHGSYFNVVGLPVQRIYNELISF